MAAQIIRSGDVELAAAIDDGDGPSVVLLHGLAGHRGEWDATAAWLRTGGFRVTTYDGRGHGDSSTRPADVTREANVVDAIAVLTELGPGRHVLAGQSLGGHTAMLAAAARPDLVSALVMLDAGPAQAEASDRIARWLASWPVPFADRTQAASFFGGGPAGAAWAAGLVDAAPDPSTAEKATGRQAAAGLVPAFDADVIVATIAAHAGRPYWTHWRSITTPTLVVLAGNGFIPADEESNMRAARPDATIVRIDGVGHDLHLEAPEAVRDIVLPWLAASVPPRPGEPA